MISGGEAKEVFTNEGMAKHMLDKKRHRHLEETQWAPCTNGAVGIDELLAPAPTAPRGDATAQFPCDAVRAGMLELRIVGVDLPSTPAGRAAFVRVEVAPGNAATRSRLT